MWPKLMATVREHLPPLLTVVLAEIEALAGEP